MNHRSNFSRHIRHIALAANLVCLGATATAAPEEQFQAAFKHFIQASSGDTSAIEQAAEAFSGLLLSEPTNPVLMAYAGSATSMKANTTMLPWKKMAFAEDGLAKLDDGQRRRHGTSEGVAQSRRTNTGRAASAR